MSEPYPAPFVDGYAAGLLAVLLVALVYVARLIVTRGRDVDSLNPISYPTLVVVGLATMSSPPWGALSLGVVFGLAFVCGLAGGMLGFSVLRAARDVVLSIVSVALTVDQVAARADDGLQQLLLLGLLLLLAGIVYCIVRMKLGRLAAIGMGALGAVETIDFVTGPFGLSYWDHTSSYSGILTLVAVVLLGFGAAVAPRLVIGLGVCAVMASDLLWNLLLWFANQNGQLMSVAPDFSGWAALAGCVLGFGLTLGFWRH